MQPMAPAQPSVPMAPHAQAAPAASGYEICIKVMGDGSYRVSKEPLDMEEEQVDGEHTVPGEGDMAGDGGDESARIDSFEGALKAAYGIYQENPEGGSGEDQMMAEYQGENQ